MLTAVAHSVARASQHTPDWSKEPSLEKCCVNLFSPFFNVQRGGDFLEPRRLTIEGLLVMEDMKPGLAIFCDWNTNPDTKSMAYNLSCL